MRLLKVGIGLITIVSAFYILPAQAQTARSAKFDCERNKSFQATFDQSNAIVTLDSGVALRMRQVPSGSGIRYVNAGYTLTSKGNAAVIERNGTTLYTNCTTQLSMLPNPTRTVSGSVSYLQRIALPPNAVVVVKLQDVSRMDVAADTIAEQTINTNGRQVPIPFTLTYDPAKINPKGRYAVTASILIDGQLRWRNTTQYPVLTQGAPSQVDVRVNQI